jgi:hypothetical protein
LRLLLWAWVKTAAKAARRITAFHRGISHAIR